MSGLMTERNSLLVLGNDCFHINDGRNPANQLIWKISHYLQGFIHSRWLAGFLNHQQYHQSFLPWLTHSPNFPEGLEAEGGPNRGSWKQDGNIERRIQFGSFWNKNPRFMN